MNLNNIVLGLAQSDQKYGYKRKKNNEPFEDILFKAIQDGITSFDSSISYKNNSKIINKIICNSKLKISTKLPSIECSIKDYKKILNNSIKKIFKKEKSIKIENFFLHDPLIVLDDKKWKITIKLLNNLKKKGFIKNIGFSVYNKQEVENILKIYIPDILQFPLNIFDQTFDNQYLKFLKTKKIKLQARSIFLQGVLCKIPIKGYFSNWKNKFILWKEYLNRNKKSAFEECLLFIINNNYIDSIVVGVESQNNLKEIVSFLKKTKKQSNFDFNKYAIFKCNDEYLIDPRLWKWKNTFQQSHMWNERCKYILNGSMLLSKNPNQFLPGKWPVDFFKAKGCKIWVNKNNFYYDFSLMGIGTCVLGYGNKNVDNFVKKTIDLSSNSTINSNFDILLSKILLKENKWASKCFFARTGGEANAIALRISRSFSKKNKVAICGYHGWHDWYLSSNLANKRNLNNLHLKGLDTLGIPKNLKGITCPFKFNDILGFKKLLNTHQDIGTVFMEVQRNVKPKKFFLQKIRKITKEKGIVLIFDECTSGFRENYGGLHKKYNVYPDIAVYGKAIGNGFPITAIVGREDIMYSAQKSFISSTFWSERVGTAAAIATLKEMKNIKSWNTILKIGKKIKKYWNFLSKKHRIKIAISGLDSMPSFNFLSKKNIYYLNFITQELMKKKILGRNTIYCSIAHEKYLYLYFKELDKIFKKISLFENKKNILRFLEHPLAKPGFQRLN